MVRPVEGINYTEATSSQQEQPQQDSSDAIMQRLDAAVARLAAAHLTGQAPPKNETSRFNLDWTAGEAVTRCKSDHSLLKEVPRKFLDDQVFRDGIIDAMKARAIRPIELQNTPFLEHAGFLDEALGEFEITYFLFKVCPESVRSNEALALKVIKMFPDAFINVTDSLKEQESFSLKAVQTNIETIVHLSRQFKRDETFLEKAMNLVPARAGQILHLADPSVLENLKLVLLATKTDGMAHCYAPERFYDIPQFVLNVVHFHYSLLAKASDRLKNDPDFIRKLITLEPEIEPLCVDFPGYKEMQQKTAAMSMQPAAPMLTRTDIERTIQRCIGNPTLLKNLDSSFLDNQEFRTEMFTVINNRRIMLRNLVGTPFLQHKDFLLEGLKVLRSADMHFYQYLTEDMQKDPERLLTTVKFDPEAIRWAGENLRSNKEFLFQAIASRRQVYQFIPRHFKTDAEFVMTLMNYLKEINFAVEQLYFLLDSSMKANREVIIRAVECSHQLFLMLDKTLQQDSDIRRAAGL